MPKVLALAAAAALLAMSLIGALAQDNCRGFIHPSCCCTNECCWEIGAHEVEPLPGDQWRVRSTGQTIRRTDWSPDGRYYRCACDLDAETRQWIRHQGANTRCLFVPMTMF